MKIASLKIENYRGLRCVEIPMSHFACLIGENNAGKSSVMQCLSLFYTGTKLKPTDYFDETKSIRIGVGLEDIDEQDLGYLEESHRSRMSAVLVDGGLTLVRVYDTTGKSSLRMLKLLPKDERLRPAHVEELTKGKSGKALVDAIVTAFPALETHVTASMNLTQARKAVADYAEGLGDEEKVFAEADLPTGFDKSVAMMLPEPIYIPAVKDPADDVKTTESASFGKLLGILLREIQPQLADVEAAFDRIQKQLNRVKHEDGTVTDDRLSSVQKVEHTVTAFLKESFPRADLKIDIPPPQLKALLSNAKITVNDGYDGPLESKGDGLKRAVTFAILRAYVELQREGVFDADSKSASVHELTRQRYILLFEEPELFLYPLAQSQLFEALKTVAENHFVVMTTHSPYFLKAGATETFVKLSKRLDPIISNRPFTEARSIDLSDMSAKAQFQIVCHENNNAAFFSDTVLLVEGDSDYIVVPHLAQTLNPEWSFTNYPIAVARVGGKSSMKRYRDFFDRFGIRVAVLTDLDAITKGFEDLGAPQEASVLKAKLIQRIDAVIAARGEIREELLPKQVKQAHGSGDLRQRWARVQDAHQRYEQQVGSWTEVKEATSDFFSWESKDERFEVLRAAEDSEVRALKEDLISRLREHDIYILSQGVIEAYYPKSVTGQDKPSKAQSFCSLHTSRDHLLALPIFADENDGELKKCEFDLIFESLLEPYSTL